MTELQGAWIGIRYAMTSLHLERLIIEDDSLTAISWIRQAFQSPPAHPSIHDIIRLLQGCSEIIAGHVYRKINFATIR